MAIDGGRRRAMAPYFSCFHWFVKVLARDRRLSVPGVLAEGAGFEPAIRFPVYTLSRRAPSTARPPLQRALHISSEGEAIAPAAPRAQGATLCAARAALRPSANGKFRRRPPDFPPPSKLFQINPSKMAFISFYLFFRIGTFQWVTRNPNKKIELCLRLCAKCLNRASTLVLMAPAPRSGSIRRMGKI